MKPQLGILLPFALAAGGYWRAFGSATFVALSMLVLTFFLFGFLNRTMPVMTAQLLHDYGILPHHAMPTVLVTLRGWGASVRIASFAQGVSTLFAIAAVIWTWRRPHTDRQWRNALTCAALLLATPFGYVYDMIPAMVAVVLEIQSGFCGGFAWLERPILAAVWVWPAITVIWSLDLGLHPIGGFLLIAFALYLMWRTVRNTSALGESLYNHLSRSEPS